MKLYIAAGSPNCRKPWAVAKHLALDIEVATLDFFAGDLKTEAYRAINPNGLVPALTDGDLHLWESNAIMAYLASQAPDGGLLPEDPRGRADVLRWQFWDGAHFGRAAATLTVENFLKPRFGIGAPDPAARDKAAGDFQRYAPILDAQLDGRPFVTGEALTLADFTLGASLTYAGPAQMPLEGYRHIAAWQRRLDEVPAWAETAPRPG